MKRLFVITIFFIATVVVVAAVRIVVQVVYVTFQVAVHLAVHWTVQMAVHGAVAAVLGQLLFHRTSAVDALKIEAVAEVLLADLGLLVVHLQRVSVEQLDELGRQFTVCFHFCLRSSGRNGQGGEIEAPDFRGSQEAV